VHQSRTLVAVLLAAPHEPWFWGGVTVFFGLLVAGGALVLVGGALGGRKLAWARAVMAWFEKMG